MKNKTILITGGAGFIGSHLCEKLSQENEVISLDNYFTGSKRNHVDGVKYIAGSTINILEDPYLIALSPDVVYHLGEYSRVEQSFDDVKAVLEYNLEGTKAVLEYVRHKRCKLIYAGSSTKFADLGKNATPYTWTKATNTELVKNYGDWFGIDYAITYFYNVYGPREISTGKYATLIALFNEKRKRGEKLTVVSPGTQRRNFTNIADTINALVLIGERGSGDEYGIGSDESYSILEIAEMFETEIEMLPERKGNRMSAPVVSDKTKELGWKAEVSIKDYIRGLTNER